MKYKKGDKFIDEGVIVEVRKDSDGKEEYKIQWNESNDYPHFYPLEDIDEFFTHITELLEPEWLPIDRIDEFDDCESLWGYYKDGIVERGAKNCDKENDHMFVSGNSKLFCWDQENQPTHIMLRVDDVKPAPPVTLYEQVKAICEGAGVECWKEYIWSRRQQELCNKHIELYMQAVEECSFATKIDYEYYHHLLCDFALKIAKDES